MLPLYSVCIFIKCDFPSDFLYKHWNFESAPVGTKVNLNGLIENKEKRRNIENERKKIAGEKDRRKKEIKGFDIRKIGECDIVGAFPVEFAPLFLMDYM